MVIIFADSLQNIPGGKEWSGCRGTVGFFREINSPFTPALKKVGLTKGSSTTVTSMADISSTGRLRGSLKRKVSNFRAPEIIADEMAPSTAARISSSNAYTNLVQVATGQR
jgi:hypothetical protein